MIEVGYLVGENGVSIYLVIRTYVHKSTGI
jgi:hypothetical protein